MRAFRRSLAASGDYDRGNQGSVTYLQDRHVPSPTNPVGVGSVAHAISGGSVIRNYQLINTPDYDYELPISFFYVNDDANPYRFKTADFSYAQADEDQAEKYAEVYGDLYVKDATTNQAPEYPKECCKWSDDYGNPYPLNPVCIEWCPSTVINTLRIMDSCRGNLMSYDGCKRQCRMITDSSFCERECERGKSPGDDKDCNEICSQTIDTPWYCSQLDNIFSFALDYNKPAVMGIQSDYSERLSISDTLQKSESGGTITTVDSLNWSGTTDRTMVYIDDSGVHQPEVSTTLGESVTQRCTDGVCN